MLRKSKSLCAPGRSRSSASTQDVYSSHSPQSRKRVYCAALLVAVLLAHGLMLPQPARPQGSCCAGGPLGPGDCNVVWNAPDSLTACPAGDSVGVFPQHPSRLYIFVHYEDNNCNPRVGVPPESLWVTYANVAGNVAVRDMGQKVFAEDSTDINGNTRIIVRSFSGCGTMRFNLFVSGKASGVMDRMVRTTDPDGDGRMEGSESALVCDLDYSDPNGIGDPSDQQIAIPHLQDWHRNALHGTLVKRTNLCDLCAIGTPNTIGIGEFGWSPSGRRLAFSVSDQEGACRIFHAASDPSGGNIPVKFSFSAPDSHDYDPSWSPLGDEIFFFRRDRVVYRKGIPGIAPDTSETAIHGNDIPKCCGAISPDGRTVAYSRLVSTNFTIWTVPAAGGAPRQITAAGNYRDFNPKWSPDGQSLIFERRVGGQNPVRSLYTVPAFQDPPAAPTLFYESTSLFSSLPSYTEDRAMVVAGAGPAENVPTAHTLDATGTSGFRPIENYPQYTYTNIFPKMSPDGTRLAMLAKNPRVAGAVSPQIWAARRNMNLPPNFTAVGGQTVADSTTRVFFTMLQGQFYSFTVTAVDPPDPSPDPLTYWAFYLQQGMAFETATRTFSWTPPSGAVGQVFHVKFQVTTPSGGADAILAVINVVQSLDPGGARARTAPPNVSVVPDVDGIVRFEVQGVSHEVQVEVFDLAGRRLARVGGRAREALRWDGRDASGRRVSSGMYFYRVQAEGATSLGRLVYLR